MAATLWYFVKLALLIAIAIFLVEYGGTVEINWLGISIVTHIGVAILVLALLISAAAGLFHLWRKLVHLPETWARRRGLSRKDSGEREVMAGLVSVAAEDARAAGQHARKAAQLLGDAALVAYLRAEVAALSGDDTARRAHLLDLSRRRETQFLGLKALVQDAIREGNLDWAVKGARRARKLESRSRWAAETLFRLEIHAENYAEADRLLHDMVRHGQLTEEIGRRRLAALLVARSEAAEAGGLTSDALIHAQKAHEHLPTFVPAAVRAARLLLRAGRHRQAEKVIESCWGASPHPDLALAWGDLGPAEAGATRLRWFRRLADLTPGDPEGQLAVGEAALAADDLPAAHAALEPLLSRAPSGRLFRLMAWLEHAEHPTGTGVQEWLARAAAAPPDPAWVCAECGAALGEWRPICPDCGTFDSLAWRVPKHARRGFAESTAALGASTDALVLPPGAATAAAS